MISADYIVVGSGLTGATIARVLADAGREVVVLERRDRIGGNVADEVHPSGIRMNLHGPHYFRTDSQRIWDWVNRFATFYKYEARIKTWVDGRYEHWPIHVEYIERVGGTWLREICEANLEEHPPQNFAQACLRIMPYAVYEKVVKGYSEKQWGVPCTELSASLAKRFDIRTDGETRLSRCKHQGIPRGGYSAWVGKMLEGIEVKLGEDIMRGGVEPITEVAKKGQWKYVPKKCLIFTGPIDEFFGYDLGKLKYRGQQRRTVKGTVPLMQPAGQVNFPGTDAHFIRCIEWKHMMENPYSREAYNTDSVLTYETPFTPTDPNDYEYPFPSDDQQALYLKYRQRAEAINGLLVCGRLGEYRYYDMDSCIARALTLAERILKNGK